MLAAKPQDARIAPERCQAKPGHLRGAPGGPQGNIRNMPVKIIYFAAAREVAGCPEESLEVPDEGLEEHDFKELISSRHANMADFLPRMRLARNGEFMQPGERICAGDEVAVLPPVAGGAEGRLCAVRDRELSVDEVLRAVRHSGAGGIAIFLGVVRDHADGKAVQRLDYEAYVEMAEREMARVMAGVEGELQGVRIAALHRVGALQVGETAVVVAASAAHRDAAFEACRATIDRIKERAPIWKKEWDPEGEALWVNLEGSDGS